MIERSPEQPGGQIKLVECPRDAMQGWKEIIPTPKKIAYLNSLLKVGFDTLDFGSFVSPRLIPQMADTAALIPHLERSSTGTRLLAIVANRRGAEEAAAFDEITFLGYPFSVSETFQRRNANSTLEESVKRVGEIIDICAARGKEPVIYLSMGFGNPYGDAYSEEIVAGWAGKLAAMGAGIILLADTVGLAEPDQILRMTASLIQALPGTEIGVHLHARPNGWREKVDAALQAGCCRFDVALGGFGGCPMADDELVGNLNSEWLIPYFRDQGRLKGIDAGALQQSALLAAEIFQP